MAFGKKLSLQLVAPVANGVSQAQAVGAGNSFNLNGGLVSNGIAVFDAPRRVLLASAGNDSGITFTVTGVNRQGGLMSETITGGNAGAVYTKGDFAAVTKVTPSGATAANVTIGTNGVGSTAPWIVDSFSVSPQIGATMLGVGAVQWQLETANDDFSLQTTAGGTSTWDVTNATWFQDMNANWPNGGMMRGDLATPLTLIRLTVLSGIGSISANLQQSVGTARI